MMGHRDKLISGDEYDVVFKAPLCVFKNNTGLKKFYKNKINRRNRYKYKLELLKHE